MTLTIGSPGCHATRRVEAADEQGPRGWRSVAAAAENSTRRYRQEYPVVGMTSRPGRLLKRFARHAHVGLLLVDATVIAVAKVEPLLASRRYRCWPGSSHPSAREIVQPVYSPAGLPFNTQIRNWPGRRTRVFQHSNPNSRWRKWSEAGMASAGL